MAPVANVLRAVIEDLAKLELSENGGERPDRMLAAADVARALGVSRRWVYSKAKALPFARRYGGALRFSERGLERWLARR